MSSHSVSASVILKNERRCKTGALQDVQNEFVESRREQTRLQEELSRKEKPLRDTQIRSKHEVGEMKRAQELRVDEVSVQKIRENHETIQQLTSQLQEIQEQINSMNDSGEFHDVGSNYCGRLSFRVLVRCLAATKDCRLTQGINLEYRTTFFEINVLRLILPEIILKEFNLTTCEETEKQSLKPGGRRQTKSRHNSNADISDKTVDYEFYNVGGITAEFNGWTAKTANIGAAIRQISYSTIILLENTIHNTSRHLF